MGKKLGSNKFINSVKHKNKLTVKYLDELKGIKYIHQKYFNNGTYRITKPGYYKLFEDIVFHPNPENDYKPKSIQKELYPTMGAYILGFFAVITIEVSNVTLDLNGYEICVSEQFNQHQRFASIIELGNSPFNTNQGPSNFGELNKAPDNITIINGKLGMSPHHGVRGNNNKNVTLRNISFKDFEVAAISLHGCCNVLIENISINGVNKKIYSLSQYSQSLFVMPFLKRLLNIDENYTFNNKTVRQIYNDMNNEIVKYKNYVFNHKDYDGFFKNKQLLPDGNVYGILLATKGVAVGDMVEERTEESIGNENIVIRNVTIKNIISQSIQIKGLKNDKRSLEASYVGKFLTGPVGDVLKINKIMDDKNIYKGDCLSDGQLLLAKRKIEFPDEKYGGASITKELINWAETKQNFNDLNLYMVNGHDSMGHVMKGNHGILISCGKNISLTNVKIENVENYGDDDNRFVDNFKELENNGEILKETSIIRGKRNLGVKSKKNNKETDKEGSAIIISDYKEMPEGEANPAIGKLFIDDKFIAVNNNIVTTSHDIGNQVTSKEKGEEIWVVVSRKVENDIKDREDKSKLSSGICLTGCEKINGSHLYIENIFSKYGNSHKILKKNINKDINI